MPSLADLARRAQTLPCASLLVSASVAILVSACPADPGAVGGGAGGFGGVAAVGGTSAGTGGSGAFGGTGGVGASGGTGGVGGSGGVGAAGTGGASGMDCGGDAYGAEPRQLDIYVILDESLSMIPYWAPVTGALNQFFMSPQAAGIGVGIHYYAGVCEVPHYETPAVPIAPLPGNAAALQMSMASRVLNLGTAATPALTGAINHARMRQIAMPETKQVVLLVGDGEPAFCGSTLDNAVAAAMAGVSGTPSIQTYVLGLGNTAALDALAVAGGTGTALIADPNNPQAVIDAMNAIRGQALPCDYGIPATTGTFDSNLVNVQHVIGGATNTIFGVTTEADCDAVTGGWYYDNRDAPTRVFACPATCAALGEGGEVKVVVGCPTEKPPD